MSDHLTDKVYNFTEREGLFSAPCHVLVGVSGGADSMALLHILLHWPCSELTVSAIHINHGIRGESADSDEQFVRDYCLKHNISLTVVSADIPAIVRAEHCSLEEAGRRVRYDSFERVRSTIGADYVLTAHTADDQAETVLMRILRGSGVDGLTGVAKKRACICRPLLCCSRTEIEEYCERNQLDYVTDETNVDRRYLRNAIRHEFLPKLKEINPALLEAIQRLSDCAALDADYLNRLARDAVNSASNEYGYSVKVLAAQPEAIRRRAIRLLLRDIPLSSVEESYILSVDKMILSNRGSVCVSDGYVLSVGQGILSVHERKCIASPEPVSVEFVPAVIRFGTFQCDLAEQFANDKIIHNLLLHSSIDYDKIIGKLYLRTRLRGDSLHPCGRGVGKSVKKLMNEWRIPAHLRDTYPLLCDDRGIVMIPGYSCDERVRVTQNTNHYLVCKVNVVQG